MYRDIFLQSMLMEDEGGDRDPKGNSLWLLPSGPDQIGETFARDLHLQYRDFRWWMQAPGG